MINHGFDNFRERFRYKNMFHQKISNFRDQIENILQDDKN